MLPHGDLLIFVVCIYCFIGKSDRNTPNIEQFKIAIKRNDIEFVKNILSEGELCITFVQ